MQQWYKMDQASLIKQGPSLGLFKYVRITFLDQVYWSVMMERCLGHLLISCREESLQHVPSLWALLSLH